MNEKFKYSEHDRNHDGSVLDRHHCSNELSSKTREKLAIITSINDAALDFFAYESDHSDSLHPKNNLTFKIGSEPMVLPSFIRSQLEDYGRFFTLFYKACDELYGLLPDHHKWKRILNHGKPEWMLALAKEAQDEQSHVFIRPDLILQEDNVVTTEIETSPFGLPLSCFLNDVYGQQGFDLSVESDRLVNEFLQTTLGDEPVDKHLCFVLTDHTRRYWGQFEFFAKLLRTKGAHISVVSPADLVEIDGNLYVDGVEIDCVYRGFYLHESVTDPMLQNIFQKANKVLPGPKFYLEEKAIMAMLWDHEFESYFKEKLGDDVYTALRHIIPPTSLINDSPISEFEIDQWEDLAGLSRSRRAFILKTSGFSDNASWARGVTFLNRLSRIDCQEVVQAAINCETDQFIVQRFLRGDKFEQEYYDFFTESFRIMTGRVRLTPYYSVESGDLLSVKATMCPNTDFIHASTNSINVPIK